MLGPSALTERFGRRSHLLDARPPYLPGTARESRLIVRGIQAYRMMVTALLKLQQRKSSLIKRDVGAVRHSNDLAF